MLCRLEEFGVTHLPLMALAADRAAREHAIFPNAQQRFEVTIDPDIDVLPGAGTDEMQPFHGGLRGQHGSDGSELSFVSVAGWPKFEFAMSRGHSVVNGEIRRNPDRGEWGAVRWRMHPSRPRRDLNRPD